MAWQLLTGHLPNDWAGQVITGRASGSLAKGTYISELLEYKYTSNAAVDKRLENSERGKNLKRKCVTENSVDMGVADWISWFSPDLFWFLECV